MLFPRRHPGNGFRGFWLGLLLGALIFLILFIIGEARASGGEERASEKAFAYGQRVWADESIGGAYWRHARSRTYLPDVVDESGLVSICLAKRKAVIDTARDPEDDWVPGVDPLVQCRPVDIEINLERFGSSWHDCRSPCIWMIHGCVHGITRSLERFDLINHWIPEAKLNIDASTNGGATAMIETLETQPDLQPRFGDDKTGGLYFETRAYPGPVGRSEIIAGDSELLFNISGLNVSTLCEASGFLPKSDSRNGQNGGEKARPSGSGGPPWYLAVLFAVGGIIGAVIGWPYKEKPKQRECDNGKDND